MAQLDVGWYERDRFEYAPLWSPLRVVELLAPVLDGSPGGVTWDTINASHPYRVPFVRGSDGSTRPDVERVKEVMTSAGLCDRVAFDEVDSLQSMLDRAFARTRAAVAAVSWVSSVSVEVEGNGLLIRTASDLSAAQKRAVALAAHEAGVAVRVEAPLGPGSPTVGLVSVPWGLVEVGADLSSLVVSYNNSGLKRLPSTTVREREREIWVDVRLPDLSELRPEAVTADFAIGYELVRFDAPIGGRRICAPQDTPLIGPGFGRIPVPSHPDTVMVPRVLGLHADDAERTLLASHFRPRLTGPADGYVTEQEPGGEEPAVFESTVELALAPLGSSS